MNITIPCLSGLSALLFLMSPTVSAATWNNGKYGVPSRPMAWSTHSTGALGDGEWVSEPLTCYNQNLTTSAPCRWLEVTFRASQINTYVANPDQTVTEVAWWVSSSSEYANWSSIGYQNTNGTSTGYYVGSSARLDSAVDASNIRGSSSVVLVVGRPYKGSLGSPMGPGNGLNAPSQTYTYLQSGQTLFIRIGAIIGGIKSTWQATNDAIYVDEVSIQQPTCNIIANDMSIMMTTASSEVGTRQTGRYSLICENVSEASVSLKRSSGLDTVFSQNGVSGAVWLGAAGQRDTIIHTSLTTGVTYLDYWTEITSINNPVPGTFSESYVLTLTYN